jgi:cysteine desulfurase/selenocysteine lyase
MMTDIHSGNIPAASDIPETSRVPASDGAKIFKKTRDDFPILKRKIYGKPLIYLDNAATSQKPFSVIQAIQTYYENSNANIHRGVHHLAEEATSAYEAVRKKTAAFIHAKDHHSILFTRNCTEAINLAAFSWGRKFLKPGDEILLTEMEHHSNLIPWHFLKNEKGIELKFIPFNEEGILNLSKLPELLSSRTKLVSLTHISNSLGTINPIKQIIEAAHEKGALVLIDGAQSVPHLPVDVQDLNCDFLAFSSHKMLGPTGVGILYGKLELLEAMDPFMGGGEMIREVWLDHSTYSKPPWKYEAGTPNIADTIGFGAALDYLNQTGMKEIQKQEEELTRFALQRFSAEKEIKVYGPQNFKIHAGIISFNLEGIHPHDVGTILDQEGIAIRAGHHCTQPLMRKLGVSGTARASFYFYNTKEEVELLLQSIQKVFQIFHHAAAR